MVSKWSPRVDAKVAASTKSEEQRIRAAERSSELCLVFSFWWCGASRQSDKYLFLLYEKKMISTWRLLVTAAGLGFVVNAAGGGGGETVPLKNAAQPGQTMPAIGCVRGCWAREGCPRLWTDAAFFL